MFRPRVRGTEHEQLIDTTIPQNQWVPTSRLMEKPSPVPGKVPAAIVELTFDTRGASPDGAKVGLNLA
jgi:hypothetical protein